MKIKTWIKYDVGYLPTPRCRKLRYKEEEDYVDIELAEVSLENLKPAFKAEGAMIYSYNGKLWTEANEGDIHCANKNNPMTALEALCSLHEYSSYYFGRWNGYTKDAHREERDSVIARAEADIAKYILVDGGLYRETSEPMYSIVTFGLGHNHGGTGFFIDWYYNPNISKDNYFNALEYEKAVNYAINVAARRGDTNDVARFSEYIKNNTYKIEVYDETLVTRNPQAEHGAGDSFLNSIESIVEASNDTTEAALLCMAVTGLTMGK